MPESIPAPLIIDTLKDTFREARAARTAEGWGRPASDHLGWILSVPDTHQKTVLAALEIVLRGEGHKAEPGVGVAAAIAHYETPDRE